jgi:hypothetical protein
MLHISLGVKKMFRFAFCSSLAILAASASAESATQTDWSGGPGSPLPVTEWDTGFGPADNVNWLSPGCLRLDMLETELASDVADFSDLVIVDLDGDGAQDVLAGSVYGNIIWLRNTGASLPWPWFVVYDHSITDTALPMPADIDGDGDQDVVFVNYREEVQWAENELPDHSWTVHSITGSDWRVMAIDAADLDGDGDMDVLGARAENEWVGWWENSDGAGTSWVEHYIDDNVWYPYCVEAADVDTDGRTDILVTDVDSDPDRARWYENPGPPWVSWPVHLINDAIDKPREISAFEMNGLPGVELLMFSVNATEMCWFEQSSPDVWTRHQIEVGGPGVWAAYPSDVDGDGDLDFPVYQAGMTVGIYWNAGSWQYQRMTLYGHPGGSAVLDYDSDGQNEMLVSHVQYNYWDIPYLGAFEFGRFEPEGRAESKVLDTQTGCDWGALDWDAVLVPGTSVSFQVASGPLYTLMRDWSDTLTAPCDLHGLLVDGDRFLQYRAIFHSSDPMMSPELQEVTITWDPLGIEGPEGTGAWIQGPCPNPVTASTAVTLDLEAPSRVRLEVLDISGRVAAVIEDRTMDCGTHEIGLPALPAGVYLLRAVCAGETEVLRFAVLGDGGSR